MTPTGWAVAPSQAEAVRRRLRHLGLLRTDLRVMHEDGRVIFPVLARPPSDLAGETVERGFRAVRPTRPASYAELFDGSAAEREILPRAYDVIGDIVLIRLPARLRSQGPAVGEALLRFVPGCRIVGDDRGVRGPERRRSLHRIAGSGGWSTFHRENGLRWEVDLGQAYFSPRLAREHFLVAEAVRPGERVLDLCAGIGPFSLLIAHQARAGSITAVEANPDAIRLLRANAKRLGLTRRVRILEGRVEDLTTELPPADRAILNLPRTGLSLLPYAADRVAVPGTLHYYEVTPRSELPSRPAELAQGLAPAGQWRAGAVHIVHEYSAKSDLVAYTLIHHPG